MKQTQPIPPEDFVPESLSRIPRHRPPPSSREQKRGASIWLWLLAVVMGVAVLLAALPGSGFGGFLRGVFGAGAVFVFVASGILLLYFLPSIIAVRRAHTNAMSVVVLNLFLGWTFLGWVASLVWSLTTQRK